MRAEIKRARAKREPFTTAELRKIFQHRHFQEKKWRSTNRHEPYRFWLFPIALMTGARQGEICQLRKVDIVVKTKPWTILQGLPEGPGVMKRRA